MARSAFAVTGPEAQNTRPPDPSLFVRSHGRMPAATAVRLVTITVSGGGDLGMRRSQFTAAIGRGASDTIRTSRTPESRSKGSTPSRVPGAESRTTLGAALPDMQDLPTG